jgi:hypothetical protein
MSCSFSDIIRDVEFLESLVDEVVKNVDGRRVSVEGEDDEETA